MSVNIKIGGKTISGVSTVQFESGDPQESVISFYEMGSVPVEEADVTPTTNVQEVLPSENKLLSKVTVEGVTASIDPNIQPENIKEGVTILGVAGSMMKGKLSEVLSKTVTELNEEDLEGCTILGAYTLYRCVSLVSVHLPTTVTEIGQNALQNCNALSDLVLNEGLETIGNYAIQNCTNLTSLVVPSTVKSVGTYAFYFGGFTSITFLPTTPPTVSSNSFDGSYPIYVPAESVDAYKASDVWSPFASRIQAIPE